MEYVEKMEMEVRPNFKDTWSYKITQVDDCGVALSYVDNNEVNGCVEIYDPDYAIAVANAMIKVATHAKEDFERISEGEI